MTGPCSGLRRGQAALPTQTPPRREPREVATPGRGRPPPGDGDPPTVTAPRDRRTPTPPGHKGQLPPALWEGVNPTFPSFPTFLAFGIPQIPKRLAIKEEKKIKRNKNTQAKASYSWRKRGRKGRGRAGWREKEPKGTSRARVSRAAAAGDGLRCATCACSNLRRSGTINRIIQRSGKAASLLLVSMTASETNQL